MAKKKARNTRGRIVSAAWKLFYEQGYEDTTIEEIIELSQTSKGSFYHYFDGKDALLSTLSLLFDEKYEEQFDAVLCDAPCSGYGTVSENPDIKLFRKKEDFAALEKAQSAILNTVSRYVKKGGALYYSTCSLFECENDKTVEKFLKAHPEYEAAEIDSPLNHEKKKYGLQFLPDTAYGAGFYVCKLQKK